MVRMGVDNFAFDNTTFYKSELEIGKLVVKLLGFDINLTIVSDGNWGVLDKNGTWNGFIKDLLENKMDFVVPYLLPNQDRIQAVGFSSYVSIHSNCFIFNKESLYGVQNLEWYNVFSIPLICTIILSKIFLHLTIYAISQHNSVSQMAQLIRFCQKIQVMLIYWFFQSRLLDFFLYSPVIPFHSLKEMSEMLQNDRFKMVVDNRFSSDGLYAYLLDCQTNIYCHEFSAAMSLKSDIIISGSKLETIKLISEDASLFTIMNSYVGKDFIYKYQHLILVDIDELPMAFWVSMMQKNATKLNEKITRALNFLDQNGISFKERNLNSNINAFVTTAKSKLILSSVTNASIMSLYFLLTCGIFAAIYLFVMEQLMVDRIETIFN